MPIIIIMYLNGTQKYDRDNGLRNVFWSQHCRRESDGVGEWWGKKKREKRGKKRKKGEREKNFALPFKRTGCSNVPSVQT